MVMPRVLEPGVLYVAEQYGAAAHLCACGCASKVRTPLGPLEWSLEETLNGPTLQPSIGNWQRPCRSHYWIVDGEVRWAGSWTTTQVQAGRRLEEERRHRYYAEPTTERGAARMWRRLVDWLRFWQ